MKYIKLYENFDITSNKKEVVDFCEENLVSLIDDGFEVQVYASESGLHIHILLDDGFKWDDINDEFITFLLKLNNYYNISNNGEHIVFTERGIIDYFRYDDIIEDDMTKGLGGRINLDKLNSIGLLVTGKKENL